MPIRRISPINPPPRSAKPLPPPVARASDFAPAAPEVAPPEIPLPTKKQRGHARKDERGKYVPTGEYSTGFARPPKASQFNGTTKSPGRPKGSVSQDSIMRRELEKTRLVRQGGKERKVKNRELLVQLRMKQAFEKPSDKGLHMLSEDARRLFPDASSEAQHNLHAVDPRVDEELIRQFFKFHSLGEPNPEAGDPLADFLTEPLGSQDLDDGDWDAPGATGHEKHDGEEDDV